MEVAVHQALMKKLVHVSFVNNSSRYSYNFIGKELAEKSLNLDRATLLRLYYYSN